MPDKGHAAQLLYAVWAELGVAKREAFTTLRSLDSDLAPIRNN